MVMKKFAFVSMLVVADCVCAWNSVSEMETDFCVALTNSDYLLSAVFTNQLSSATNLTSAESRCEVFMLSAIHAAQSFEVTVDERWIQEEMKMASNAVAAIGMQTNKWQYWMSRFVYAGAYASQSDYGKSLFVMTNSLSDISSSACTNDSVPVCRAMLGKFEMPDIGVVEAMKVMAGMSAAAIGESKIATNYASQVAMPYRNTILEFAK